MLTKLNIYKEKKQFQKSKILYIHVRLKKVSLQLGRFTMLMALWQVQKLTREINDLERDAIKVRTRLTHYQKYANKLGGSSIMTMGHVAGLSAELLPRATMFAQYSNQASSMSAMQQLQMMKMNGMVPWTGNQMTQMQYEMSAFARFKEQSMKALKQQEIDAMSEIEKEIELEMNSIEAQIKQKKAMRESCESLLKEEVQNYVPKFGLG